MPSKLSGGKRATIKKRKAQKAARKRAAGGADPRKVWLGKVSSIGGVPKDADEGHNWLGRAALIIVEATLTDTAVPAEQLRRDAMKQIEQASKVLNPAKLSEELEVLHKAFKELKAKKAASKDSRQEHHAGDNAASEAGGAPPGATRP